MKRLWTSAALLAAALLLGACSEKPQTDAHGVRVDAAPWTGTGAQANTGTPFTAPGWKVGDRASWQEHLKQRANNGQNEYTRIN
jgi:hypothetical protein